MVIAVFTDDFLCQIGIADLDVLTVGRRLHIKGVPVPFHFEGKAAQDIQYGIRGNFDAQDAVDAA